MNTRILVPLVLVAVLLVPVVPADPGSVVDIPYGLRPENVLCASAPVSEPSVCPGRLIYDTGGWILLDGRTGAVDLAVLDATGLAVGLRWAFEDDRGALLSEGETCGGAQGVLIPAGADLLDVEVVLGLGCEGMPTRGLIRVGFV